MHLKEFELVLMQVGMAYRGQRVEKSLYKFCENQQKMLRKPSQPSCLPHLHTLEESLQFFVRKL